MDAHKRRSSKNMEQIQVQISYSDDGSIMYLKTPWSRDFVNALKASIPYFYRKWNGVSKIWEVSGGYHSVAKDLIDTYYEGTIESSDAQPDAALYRLLFLIPGAPKELISAAYIALGAIYNKAKEHNKITELVATYGSIMEHLESLEKAKKVNERQAELNELNIDSKNLNYFSVASSSTNFGSGSI